MKWDYVFLISIKLLPAIIGMVYIKKLSLPYLLLFTQVFFALIFESVGVYINLILKQENVWWFNIYFLIEGWILGLIGIVLVESTRVKKIAFGTLSVLTVAWFLFVYRSGLREMLSQYLLLQALFLITLFIAVLIKDSVFGKERMVLQPVFIVSISIIVFYVSIIPLFGVMNYLIDTDMPTAERLFSINQFANYFRYSLAGVVFYLCARQVTNKQTAN